MEKSLAERVDEIAVTPEGTHPKLARIRALRTLQPWLAYDEAWYIIDDLFAECGTGEAR